MTVVSSLVKWHTVVSRNLLTGLRTVWVVKFLDLVDAFVYLSQWDVLSYARPQDRVETCSQLGFVTRHRHRTPSFLPPVVSGFFVLFFFCFCFFPFMFSTERWNLVCYSVCIYIYTFKFLFFFYYHWLFLAIVPTYLVGGGEIWYWLS